MRSAAYMLILLAAFAAPTGARAGDDVRPEFAPLLYISFDGSPRAMAGDEELKHTGGDSLTYVEGVAGQAADFGEGDAVEYADIPALDPRSGTIQVWVKPSFPTRDLNDHYYLRMTTPDGESGIEVNFASRHCGPRVLFWNGDKSTNVHADFCSLQDRWNQLVITWDHYDVDLWNLRLYLNGRVRAYQKFHEVAPPTVLRVGSKSETEATDAAALIDEVAIYNRALAEMQVLELFKLGNKGAAGIPEIQARVARDEAEAQR
ncbi:MAG: LamG domain-containing protein, partial [Armatimonadetes bacterium]|nr:LamG domain-containing protein [Armatimonadota bacterium]